MHSLLKIDIAEMSVAERIQLAEDLWDSITENPEAVAFTQIQQQELDQRLENYHQNPTIGSTWEDIKQRLNTAQ